jgi:predicted DNA repair protein MutK
VLFNYNSNITNAKKRLIVKSQIALYSVSYKIRNIKIPIDLQLKIFDTLVAPILLYGSEVLGFENNDNIEKVHLQFLKKNLGVRITTLNFLVYSELGRYPLIVNIKCRMLCFWSKLVSSSPIKLKEHF